MAGEKFSNIKNDNNHPQVEKSGRFHGIKKERIKNLEKQMAESFNSCKQHIIFETNLLTDKLVSVKSQFYSFKQDRDLVLEPLSHYRTDECRRYIDDLRLFYDQEITEKIPHQYNQWQAVLKQLEILTQDKIFILVLKADTLFHQTEATTSKYKDFFKQLFYELKNIKTKIEQLTWPPAITAEPHTDS